MKKYPEPVKNGLAPQHCSILTFFNVISIVAGCSIVFCGNGEQERDGWRGGGGGAQERALRERAPPERQVHQGAVHTQNLPSCQQGKLNKKGFLCCSSE